jgi:hypothetical protein
MVRRQGCYTLKRAAVSRSVHEESVLLGRGFHRWICGIIEVPNIKEQRGYVAPLIFSPYIERCEGSTAPDFFWGWIVSRFLWVFQVKL